MKEPIIIHKFTPVDDLHEVYSNLGLIPLWMNCNDIYMSMHLDDHMNTVYSEISSDYKRSRHSDYNTIIFGYVYEDDDFGEYKKLCDILSDANQAILHIRDNNKAIRDYSRLKLYAFKDTPIEFRPTDSALKWEKEYERTNNNS